MRLAAVTHSAAMGGRHAAWVGASSVLPSPPDPGRRETHAHRKPVPADPSRAAAAGSAMRQGGCTNPFLSFSLESDAVFQDTGRWGSGSADSGSDPPCRLGGLFMVRLLRASDAPWPSPSPRCRHPPSGGSWNGPSSPTLRAETASLGCVDPMHRFRALSPRSRAVCHELSQFGRQVGFSAAAAHAARKSRMFWRISRAGTFDRR